MSATIIKNQFQGFLEFVRQQGVVGLAVGFILGGAVSKVDWAGRNARGDEMDVGCS
ncbi:MAG: hypothetical protein HYR90_01245 [Candidatus Andersenbacteria bacterium]|nr:hypothetical protein [Candidatus Andersenbacteria bacterium]